MRFASSGPRGGCERNWGRRPGGGDAVMAVLRAAVKAAAAAVPAAQLTRLGLPALAGVIGLTVLVLAVICWLLASDARCERVPKMLGALARRARSGGRGYGPGPGSGALAALAAGPVTGRLTLTAASY